MKIIYVNCGVKNYMKEDHRSYATFAVAKRKAEKDSGLYRIRTPDHCDTQLRCTGIAEVRGLNPVQASVFFVSGFLFATAKVA